MQVVIKIVVSILCIEYKVIYYDSKSPNTQLVIVTFVNDAKNNKNLILYTKIIHEVCKSLSCNYMSFVNEFLSNYSDDNLICYLIWKFKCLRHYRFSPWIKFPYFSSIIWTVSTAHQQREGRDNVLWDVPIRRWWHRWYLRNMTWWCRCRQDCFLSWHEEIAMTPDIMNEINYTEIMGVLYIF